jgi:protein-S-isoprenylcysteine O-methyltransferase Ste14
LKGSYIRFALLLVLVAISAPVGAIKIIEPREPTALHIAVAVLGGLVLLFGIILAFRGGKESAEVTVSLPGGFNMTLSRVGQGIVLVTVGALILLAALYLMPKKETTVTTIERRDGHEVERMAR